MCCYCNSSNLDDPGWMTQNKNTLACNNTDFLINNCFVCSGQLEQALLGLILVHDNLFLGRYCCFFLEPFFALPTTARCSQIAVNRTKNCMTQELVSCVSLFDHHSEVLLGPTFSQHVLVVFFFSSWTFQEHFSNCILALSEEHYCMWSFASHVIWSFVNTCPFIVALWFQGKAGRMVYNIALAHVKLTQPQNQVEKTKTESKDHNVKVNHHIIKKSRLETK